MDYRTESDSMGPVKIPREAYWGAQTQRALENFSVSAYRIPRALLRALAIVKRSAAVVNTTRLGADIARSVIQAADEVIAGVLEDHFPVDVFQTGSGTSWNMNCNEVIANRANEILGFGLGLKQPVHPNDHVNMGQSSNDVIPTAINIACRDGAGKLEAALTVLGDELEKKSSAFAGVLKLARTHLQDAVPMTLGQEFSAYAVQVKKHVVRLKNTYANLEELVIGGTAVGTGLNAPDNFDREVTAEINNYLNGLVFTTAGNKFEGIAARDAQVELFGALNGVAVSLIKIANDIRLLASGPRAGLNEIRLPALQPGSSIMPGKVNPVIAEMVVQAGAAVMGRALSVSLAAQNAPLDLNIMMPLIGYESVTCLELLSGVCLKFAEKCVAGIEANQQNCQDSIEKSLAMVTPLVLKIGYDRAAQLAQKAYAQGRTIREVILEEGVLSAAEASLVLDPRGMLGHDLIQG